MAIPSYPNFRPLEIEDLDIFNQAFSDNPPVISEFTFTNLYAWRQIYKLQVAALDNFILIRSDAQKRVRFFVPIGKGDIKTAMEHVLKDTAGTFMRVPEITKSSFDCDTRFKIELDRDNLDYLFKTNDLVLLPGAKYDGKRNLIKKFQSMHKYEYVKLNAVNANRCLEFEEAWCSIKNCDSIEGLDNERSAIREMVKNFSILDLVGGAIEVEGKIYAVAVGQKLNDNTLVVHILKADPNVTGLYQVINNEFLKQEGANFTYVNLEQDLGIEGLRKAKLSYHPADIVKKYKLSLS
jgi:hypothetical protein